MSAARKNILMIDDDKDFVLSTKTFLEGRGYLVDTAHNGTEGWEKIQVLRPGGPTNTREGSRSRKGSS